MRIRTALARRLTPIVGLLAAAACAPVGSKAGDRPSLAAVGSPPDSADTVAAPASWKPRKPVIPPRVAMLAGLLPLRALGIDTFRLNYPDHDGRGVLIAILDNGISPGVAGLVRTSTGEAKLLDLRDFSGEGKVVLERLESITGDTVELNGCSVAGFGRVRSVARPPFYAGLFREMQVGGTSAADVNGNGSSTDEFPVVVARHRGDWVVVTDTDGDGSLAGEELMRDYSAAQEFFYYHTFPGDTTSGPLSIAVNIGHDGPEPTLDFYFDDSGHGTHVAGIAAGNDMFGVEGFDGVAPGAQLLGLKIADNFRGGISIGGSVVSAMEHAARIAAERGLSLVINMSHGIGNEVEGTASIDSIVNEFTYRFPNVAFVVSAGNQGPGVSTVGFPGSAQQAMSVCALLPGVFTRASSPSSSPGEILIAPWSARGGEVAKPDLCAPGKAFSTVPLWHAGNEVLQGTSQAAPQVAGAAAVLQSAMRARSRSVRAVEIVRALRNTATMPPDATVLDAGAGVPNLSAALDWLRAGHQAGVYSIEALAQEGHNRKSPAAFRRSGLASPSDTIQRFTVTSVAGQPAARLLLDADVDWIRTPPVVEPQGGPVTIDLSYERSKLSEPGMYVGTVTARSATDTSAGPLFELVNTVVVPHGLSPQGYVKKLAAGAVHRHFVEVSEGSGGLEVAVKLADPTYSVSLYLFEPDGRPFPQGERVVGGLKSSSGAINVGAGEILPGVYEAVVLAPPPSEVSYWLQVAAPDIVVESVANGPVASIRNLANRPSRAIVSAKLVGAVARRAIHGSGSTRENVRVVPPGWAEKMLLEVSLPEHTWNQLTGFGVTVFDTAGMRVSDGPLSYSGARQVVDLSSSNYFAGLDVELMPAFAHMDSDETWSAELGVVFLLPEPVSLSLSDGSERAGVVIEPRSAREISFALESVSYVTRADLVPLVDVMARLPVGPPSIRREAVRPLEDASRGLKLPK